MMKKSRQITGPRVLVSICAALFAIGWGSAADLEASGKITRVTVYPDRRAEVVREVKVQLPAGASQLLVSGLPIAIDVDSLRVTATGVPAVLGAVELKVDAQEPGPSPDFDAADADVKRIEAQLANLDALDAVGGEMTEYLRSVRAGVGDQASMNLAGGKVDLVELEAVYGMLKRGFTDIQKEKLSRDQARKELLRELEIARAKRDATRPRVSVRSLTAVVDLSAQRAGPLTVSLAYLVPSSSWRPAYRATLDADTGSIDLVVEGVVKQSSGEDWTDIGLTLSTAEPSRGVSPPKLASWLLRPARRFQESLRLSPGVVAPDEYGVEGGVEGGAADFAVLPPIGEANPPMPPPPSGHSVTISATTVHTAYNVSFAVPGTTDLPADGREHRVTLGRQSLTAQLRYRAVPGSEEAAYLTATATAPGDYPLLGGAMRVFAGPSFLGAFTLDETPPGGELVLPFGIDNRIKVTRAVLPQARSREGFGGRDKQVVFGFKTTLENLRDRAVEIVVEDRVPVSEDERIKVAIDDATTPGHKEDPERPGILEWTLELKPKEKREIVLQYSVRHPKDLPVPGI